MSRTFYEWRLVSSGIPQGSVLGPVLIIIFINDLPDVIKYFIKLYADDAKIFSTVNHQLDKLTLKEDIRRSEFWAADWNFFYNKPKCKYLYFGKQEYIKDYGWTWSFSSA